ncbi:GTP:AMP phosphotransferase AK3, mitochondrial isoform X3 [Nasonia vitripennis]|uniref:GTP:AMP phosphotransferase, mitochondrial n=1 Tax=Nasonia vitripennis TaxID=7425 RepID=A0A7M7GDR7_NASVI|nr:GTP:AMP phosphotransferase AK3, mitochondrial isoform X3 [Nasonia vitripennis]
MRPSYIINNWEMIKNMTLNIRAIGIVASLVIAWCLKHYWCTDCISLDRDSIFQSCQSDGKQADLGRQQEDQDTGSTTKTAMVGVSYSRMAAQAAFRAVILGAPGSGKGTISARIVKQFDVKHISSGDKLRYHIANQTDLGKKVKKYLDSGMLVPDETMIALISEEIKTLEGRNWLLDGFPRTRAQAEALQKIYPLSLVINVDVPDSVIVERLKNRWVHLPSGRVYNIGFNDPKVPGRDDVTGELLVQRPDDQPEVVQERLHVYATKTKPLIDYYKQLNVLKSFAGNTTDSMWPAIKETIGQYLGR